MYLVPSKVSGTIPLTKGSGSGIRIFLPETLMKLGGTSMRKVVKPRRSQIWLSRPSVRSGARPLGKSACRRMARTASCRSPAVTCASTRVTSSIVSVVEPEPEP
jgi:hypothetical protein